MAGAGTSCLDHKSRPGSAGQVHQGQGRLRRPGAPGGKARNASAWVVYVSAVFVWVISAWDYFHFRSARPASRSSQRWRSAARRPGSDSARQGAQIGPARRLKFSQYAQRADKRAQKRPPEKARRGFYARGYVHPRFIISPPYPPRLWKMTNTGGIVRPGARLVRIRPASFRPTKFFIPRRGITGHPEKIFAKRA